MYLPSLLCLSNAIKVSIKPGRRVPRIGRLARKAFMETDRIYFKNNSQQTFMTVGVALDYQGNHHPHEADDREEIDRHRRHVAALFHGTTKHEKYKGVDQEGHGKNKGDHCR